MNDTDLDDSELLEQVCRRDPRAWRTLVRRHEARARRAVRDVADAECPLTDDQVDDIVGDTWLLLLEDDLRRLRSFRGDDLGAWVAMIASQVAMNTARELARDQPDSFDETVHSPREMPKLIDEEQPINQKPAYLTVSQAALELNVSPKTVYRLVWRGELAARRVGRTLRIASTAVSDGERRPRSAGIGRTAVVRSGRGSRSGIGGR